LTFRFAASIATVLLLGDARNLKRWAHRREKRGRVVSIRLIPTTSSRNDGGPTASWRASAWGRCVERIVYVFFYRRAHVYHNPSPRPMYLLHKKPPFRHSENGKRVFRGHDGKTSHTALIPIPWHTHVRDVASFRQTMHAHWT
jgi:hypothetical protein